MRIKAVKHIHGSVLWVVLIALWWAAPCVSASDTPYDTVPSPQIQSFVDWKSGTVVIEAVITLREPVQAKTRYAAEKRIEEEISEAFLLEIWDFPVDSVRTLGDILAVDAEILDGVRELSARGVKEKAAYTRDMKSVLVRYAFPLFGAGGLANTLIRHQKPFPVPRILGFVPTRSYSGIVIFAKGEYEQFGKLELGTLKPALFPKIYDEEMNLVLEKSMCDPDGLRDSGMIAYSDDLDLRRYSHRIGSFPLTLMAKAVFGVNSTDIIITTDDAAKILSIEENRRLLSQAKIVVIYDDLSPTY
jgi:hypothetical protein